MRNQWKSAVMMAVFTLGMGMAAPVWSLEDPLQENYTAHVIPFYKIDAGWSAFLVVADTSFRDLNDAGSPISMQFFSAAGASAQTATVDITRTDAQLFALHDPGDANGQFDGIPTEGVILLDGDGNRFLTYILLVNGNYNSMFRIDSIPCQGDQGGPCFKSDPTGNGRWLRYDTFNTVAATFKKSSRTNLYFFSTGGDPTTDLDTELRKYGTPLHGDWAKGIHLDAWCDEIYLGGRVLNLQATQRVNLSSLNYTFLNTFPGPFCSGKPGHIETYASDNGIDVVEKDYSGFQELAGELSAGGYMHHSE